MSGLNVPAGAPIFNNTYPKAIFITSSGNCFIHKGSPWTNEDQHLLHSSVAPLQLLGCTKTRKEVVIKLFSVSTWNNISKRKIANSCQLSEICKSIIIMALAWNKTKESVHWKRDKHSTIPLQRATHYYLHLWLSAVTPCFIINAGQCISISFTMLLFSNFHWG